MASPTSALRLYLYHIPQVSGVAVSPASIERLAAAYPAIVSGVKDSEGNLDHTLGILRASHSSRSSSVTSRTFRRARGGRGGHDLRYRQSVSTAAAPAMTTRLQERTGKISSEWRP